MHYITSIQKSSKDWARETNEHILNKIEEQISSYESILPLGCVPFSSKVYFTEVQTLFPQEKSCPIFLGQLLLKRDNFFEGENNVHFLMKIKSLKKLYGVKVQKHINPYEETSKLFRRYPLGFFYSDIAFLNAVAEKMNIKKIALSPTTEIGDNQYRRLFNPVERNELTIPFKKLHLCIYLNWIKNNS